MNKANWVQQNCKFAQEINPQPPIDQPPISAPQPPQPKMLKVYDTRSEWVEDQEGQGGDSWAGDPVVENEEEINCTPDEYDLEDGLDAAIIAARYILRNNTGNLEPSSSAYHQGLWYSSSENDIRTGDILERSFHPKGFTPEEEKKIFDVISRKNRVQSSI